MLQHNLCWRMGTDTESPDPSKKTTVTVLVLTQSLLAHRY